MEPHETRNPPQAPPLFNATPHSILEDANTIIEINKTLLDRIASNVSQSSATFRNVLHPILDHKNANSSAINILGFYQLVSPDVALRDASRKAKKLLHDYEVESGMRSDIFKLVEAVYSSRAEQNLDKESLHILEKERTKAISKGLLLNEDNREKYKDMQKHIYELLVQSFKNMLEEKGGEWFTMDELEGVSAEQVDLSTLENGTGEKEGKVKIPFKPTYRNAVQQYAVNEKTRRDYTIAENNKLKVNIPLFKEIISLRDEAARLLGYPNHAAVVISQKMAKSPERVTQFLEDLHSRLQEGGKREATSLLDCKRKDLDARGISFDGETYLWDVPFYSRLLKDKDYKIDEVEISHYFPIDSTFAGMLRIFEAIFGLHFVQVHGENGRSLLQDHITWHEDVLLYSVWDEEALGGEFRGYLYLDFYPRDGKHGHFAHFPLGSGFEKPDGSREYPVSVLVCNFSKPTATKPALLKHQEVWTLFHELGHAIHHLVSKTKYSVTHGTAVSRDFVEAPSQMLENWCWMPDIMRQISQHWQTKEKIPEQLIQRLVKTKHVNSATEALRYVQISMFDMQIHTPSSQTAAKEANYAVLWNQSRRQYSGIKGPEDIGHEMDWGHRYLNISHFLDGYDAGYYAYLYSQVFSYDIFHTKFKADPMNKEEGRRYRNMVLEKGGSMDELEMLTDYLGREPDSKAFYDELALS